MSCKCDLLKWWNRPYAIACKLINKNDVVIDVGCMDGAGLHEIKTHLKTHDKNITTIGIDIWDIKNANDWNRLTETQLENLGGLDFLKNRDIERMESMDEFINKPVNMVNLDEIADVVLCFGFACYIQINKEMVSNYNRNESYHQMATFLRQDGKAIYQVFKEEKYFKIILVRILNKLGCSLPTNKRVMYVKVMTKQEAISHAENCITKHMRHDGNDCNHGIIVDTEIY